MKRLILTSLCVLFFASTVPGTASGSLDEYCVAHYKMNDNNSVSSVVVDSQGYSNGTFHGIDANTSAHSVAGKVGGALTFNGASDYVSTIVAATPTNGSVAFWFYPVTPVSSEIMFGSALSAVPSPRWYIGLNSAGKFGAGIGSQNYNTIYGGAALQATTWYFGALTWDANVNLFLDGTGIYSGSKSGTICTLPAYIGSVNSDSSPAAYFKGKIDNVMIFNKTLTPEEITFLYNGGFGTETIPEPATIGMLGLGALSLIRRKR